MGEILTDFSLEFNGSVKLEAREERLTSEAGAVLLREVDERLGLTRWLGERLTDTRDEKRVTTHARRQEPHARVVDPAHWKGLWRERPVEAAKGTSTLAGLGRSLEDYADVVEQAAKRGAA